MVHCNPDLIISNIQNLMKENKITQTELAKSINGNQTSISKFLNPDAKKRQRLSLEFVFDVAQFFNISIDELCSGPKTEPTTYGSVQPSVYDVCSSLAIIFKSRYPYVKRILHKQTAYLEITDDYGQGTGEYYPDHDNESTYNSLFFPNYLEIDYHLETDDVMDDYRMFGNDDNRNIKINCFLNKLVDLLNIYRNDSINYESYVQAIETNLNQLCDK